MCEKRRKIPACLWIVERQLKSVLCRMDYWIIVITLTAFFSIILTETRDSLAAGGEKAGIFSIFPLLLGDSSVVLLITAGYLFLASDVPEIFPYTQMQILRVDRAVWYVSQWIYITSITVIYYVSIDMIAILFLFPQVELNHSAWAEGLSSFFLIVFLSVFFAGVCCICNLLSVHAGTGIVIDAIFIFLYLLYDHGSLSLGVLSPMEMFAKYTGSGGGGFYGYVSYYVILNTVFVALGFTKLSKADLRSG